MNTQFHFFYHEYQGGWHWFSRKKLQCVILCLILLLFEQKQKYYLFSMWENWNPDNLTWINIFILMFNVISFALLPKQHIVQEILLHVWLQIIVWQLSKGPVEVDLVLLLNWTCTHWCQCISIWIYLFCYLP